MFAMIGLNLLAVSGAVEFVVRQAAQYGASLDLSKVEADYDARVRKLVPGEAYDDAVVACVNKCFEALKTAAADSDDWVKLVNAAVAKDWAGARAAVRAIIVHAVGPELGQLLAAA